MANENVGVYEPGVDLTCHASAAVTGKRFVSITGNRQTADNGGNITVAHTGAGAKAFGVSKYDAASGGKVGVMRGNSRVTYVNCAANLAAGQDVESDASGRAIVKASGVAVGFAVTAATSGADAEISLY
ncbi:capsid cement protein [Blastococcus sp. CT_GayMR16]|uniref:capsid cement protein n=1 Tax=Blastococcus sp. CT_GayMR16 TaxID=2559607 RepID=UPI001073B214|nr:capsid cement protein [Blastococcus sp. CT_GayMR16]TFV90399.1 DUF2190 domain-containing protein [Blastococcus sp. CT_GayMR16]